MFTRVCYIMSKPQPIDAFVSEIMNEYLFATFTGAAVNRVRARCVCVRVSITILRDLPARQADTSFPPMMLHIACRCPQRQRSKPGQGTSQQGKPAHWSHQEGWCTSLSLMLTKTTEQTKLLRPFAVRRVRRPSSIVRPCARRQSSVAEDDGTDATCEDTI